METSDHHKVIQGVWPFFLGICGVFFMEKLQIAELAGALTADGRH
jgi:drug/metabolite transporter (DMT)-like permease